MTAPTRREVRERILDAARGLGASAGERGERSLTERHNVRYITELCARHAGLGPFTGRAVDPFAVSAAYEDAYLAARSAALGEAGRTAGLLSRTTPVRGAAPSPSTEGKQ